MLANILLPTHCHRHLCSFWSLFWDICTSLQKKIVRNRNASCWSHLVPTQNHRCHVKPMILKLMTDWQGASRFADSGNLLSATARDEFNSFSSYGINKGKNCNQRTAWCVTTASGHDRSMTRKRRRHDSMSWYIAPIENWLKVQWLLVHPTVSELMSNYLGKLTVYVRTQC